MAHLRFWYAFVTASLLMITLVACGGGGGGGGGGGTNVAPIANAQSVNVNTNSSVQITLTATDANNDSLTFNAPSQPANGDLSGTAPNLTYSPNEDFVGSDSFTFSVSDGTTSSNTATVSITVAAANNAPVANSQSLTLTSNSSLAITLTGSDVDQDTITFNTPSSPSNGSLSGTAPNVTYSPNEDFVGSDSFTFTVNDGTINSASASINLTITASVDTTPDAFDFADIPEVPPSQVVVSDTITISGINSVTPVSISGGEYSINGAAFTTDSGNLNNSDTVSLRLTASATASDTLTSTVTIGGVSASFSVTTSGDTVAPTTSFLFPTDTTHTFGRQLTVRGTTADNGTVSSVTVNGTDATSTDNFATWTADVILQDGQNILVATATDLGGNSTTNGSQIIVEATANIRNPALIEFDSTNSQALIFAGSSEGLFRFDGVSNETTRVFDSTTPETTNRVNFSRDFDYNNASQTAYFLEGFNLDQIISADTNTGLKTLVTRDTDDFPAHFLIQPNHVSLDKTNNILYILDATPTGQGRNAVLAYDINTQVVRTVTNNTGSRFTWPDSMTFDETGQRLLVADTFGTNRIWEVDIQTGDRNRLTLQGDDSLPAPKGIVMDNVNNRALVYDSSRGIAEIDLASGDITVLVADASIGGVNTFSYMDMAYDATNDRLFVVSQGSNIVYEIDLAAGTQTNFSDNSTPDANNPLSAPVGIEFDSTNNRLYVTNSGSNARSVMEVDLSDGSRTIISDDSTPDATNGFSTIGGIAVVNNNLALVVDRGLDSILSVDLNDGSRTSLTRNDQPDDNNTFFQLHAIAEDSANGLLYVADSGRQSVITVDTSTGDRNVISSPSIPDETNPIGTINGMILEGGRGLLLDDGNNNILSVNLSTGARTVFSGAGVPDSNNLFNSPRELTLDSANNRLLVVDANRIMAVSLADGIRTILSDNTSPDGNLPFLQAEDIEVDAANQRALVLDRNLARTIAVDLVSGARTLYQGGTHLTQPVLHRPTDIVYSATLDQLVVFTGLNNVEYRGFQKIDSISGNRSWLVTNQFPTPGVSVPFTNDMLEDSANQRLLTVGGSGVYEIDINSAAINRISGSNFPDNVNPFTSPFGLELDSTNNQVFVTDISADTIFAVSLADGTRTIVSDNTTPDAVNPLSNARTIAYDADNSRILALDSRTIIAIDVASGTRTILSDNSTPDSNNRFSSPVDLILDKVNNRILVLDRSRGIIAVDLTTGVRTYLRLANFNPSTAFADATKISLTNVANQIVVVDSYNGVIKLDLTNGEQVILSK